ANCFSKPR
nr:Chain C, ALA-ASN-CYS-PHE-SER-LYS-PRO-ARG [Homo sapiens]7OWU_D Chain D, ALA-ASN-CYS-PHE-SER-LYS-PRO-ARG [Homo sapiens]